LSRRPHLPILGGIHLKAVDGQLELTATDMTMGLRVKVPAQIELEGETTVSGRIFVDTVGFFGGKQTTLELIEKEILAKNGRDRVKIPTMTEEFPLFDDGQDEAASVSVDVKFWDFVNSKVAYATSKDQSRPALTGVLLKSSSDKLNVVGTDGFRVVVWENKKELVNQENLSVILNAKAIGDVVAIAGILDEEKVSFYHNEASEQVVFAGERFSFFSKLINATYPPYETIIPLEFTTRATLDRQELIKNLAKASVFSKTSSNTVKIHIGETETSFAATGLNEGSFEGAQETVKFSGAELDVAFKIEFLLDFLGSLEGETVEFDCNTSVSPVKIHNPEVADLFCVMMPFKPKN